MTQFFWALGEQERRLREETGTVTAIAGMLRAPLDIIADKLRGYVGLVEDLHVRPGKVRAACEALMPHLAQFALATADPSRRVPIGFWMHRGCVPFVTPAQFDSVFWPTLEPIVREIWAHGHQTLFYAEGDWRRHYGAFAGLPDRSIVLHVDRADPFEAKRALGAKFCLSGGVPNTLLARGSPEDVRSYCRKLLEGVGREGVYIMDASAILQNDARVENLRAMTEATLEHGVCPRGRSVDAGGPEPAAADRRPGAFVRRDAGARPAGTCIPWSRVRGALPPVAGDEDVCRRVWDGLDAAGYMFIWTVFLVF
jgi:uroporphyrinogen-III decarboxylase